jgi:arylsulfatase A-like enzyme
MEGKPTQKQLQKERGYDTVTEDLLRKIVANYYGNISLVDDQVGEILNVLASKGLKESTLIAFTSDHGDHLGDHRLLHKSGVTFYDICVRVPYIISYPPLFPPGVVCENLVETIDLPPTFLDVAGISKPVSMQGRSLVGLAEGNIKDWRDDAFSEIDLRLNPRMHGPHDPDSRDYVAMICTREWKYIHFPNLGIGELYDLVNDPHELDNLFYNTDYAPRVAEMRLRLLNRYMLNQQPYIGENTPTFREHYQADHRPPQPIPGVKYAPPHPE